MIDIWLSGFLAVVSGLLLGWINPISDWPRMPRWKKIAFAIALSTLLITNVYTIFRSSRDRKNAAEHVKELEAREAGHRRYEEWVLAFTGLGNQVDGLGNGLDMTLSAGLPFASKSIEAEPERAADLIRELCASVGHFVMVNAIIVADFDVPEFEKIERSVQERLSQIPKNISDAVAGHGDLKATLRAAVIELPTLTRKVKSAMIDAFDEHMRRESSSRELDPGKWYPQVSIEKIRRHMRKRLPS